MGVMMYVCECGHIECMHVKVKGQTKVSVLALLETRSLFCSKPVCFPGYPAILLFPPLVLPRKNGTLAWNFCAQLYVVSEDLNPGLHMHAVFYTHWVTPPVLSLSLFNDNTLI